MSKLKKFFLKITKSDYVTVFSFDMLAKALVVFSTVFLVRMLSVEDYATYSNFTEIAGLITNTVGAGLSIPFVTYSVEQNSRGKGSGNVLFNTCSLLMAVLTLLIMPLYPVAMNVYHLPINIALLAILYGGFQSQNKLAQSYFQSKNEFKRSGYVTNFKNISLLICMLAVFLIFKHISAASAALITAISALIAFAACFVLIWKNSHFDGLHVSGKVLWSLFSESKWLILYYIFQSFFGSVCIVLLNKFGTTSDVANFGVANKYYNLLLMFLASLHTVLRVKTCGKEMVDSAEKRREFSLNWVKKVFPVVAVVCLLGELCAGFVFPMLNGAGYEDSISVFRILLIAVFAGYLFSPNTSILIAAKKHKTILLLAVIGCAVGGALCYFLIPVIGVNAAAVSIVVSNLFLNGTGFILIMNRKQKTAEKS